MSSSIEQLEAGLREAWAPEQLAVYADALQARGDVRGELVAIDLERDRGNASEELEARRRELVGRYVPEHAAIRMRYGFLEIVDAVPMPILDRVLLGPCGPYLRSLQITAPAKLVPCIVETLALVCRPWLERLAIQQQGGGSTQLSHALGLQLAHVLPRLRTLQVTGREVIPVVRLPTIRTLTATPIEAVGPLTAGIHEDQLPAVVELDTTLQWSRTGQQGWLSPRQLPALRSLDLSRSPTAGYGFDLFRALSQLEILGQLERLRLPAPTYVNQASELQRTLDRMPALTRLELVGPCPFQLYTPADIVRT